MVDIKRAMISPSSVFAYPREVVNSKEISEADKIKILEQWEYDAQELLTASGENMAGDTEENGELLSEIHQYLAALKEKTSE